MIELNDGSAWEHAHVVTVHTNPIQAACTLYSLCKLSLVRSPKDMLVLLSGRTKEERKKETKERRPRGIIAVACCTRLRDTAKNKENDDCCLLYGWHVFLSANEISQFFLN